MEKIGIAFEPPVFSRVSDGTVFLFVDDNRWRSRVAAIALTWAFTLRRPIDICLGRLFGISLRRVVFGAFLLGIAFWNIGADVRLSLMFLQVAYFCSELFIVSFKVETTGFSRSALAMILCARWVEDGILRWNTGRAVIRFSGFSTTLSLSRNIVTKCSRVTLD